jgi:hypothetical protein
VIDYAAIAEATGVSFVSPPQRFVAYPVPDDFLILGNDMPYPDALLLFKR